MAARITRTLFRLELILKTSMRFSVLKMIVATTGFCCSLAAFSYIDFLPLVNGFVSILAGLALLLADRQHFGQIPQVCVFCFIGTVLGAMIAPSPSDVDILIPIVGCMVGAFMALVWFLSTGQSGRRHRDNES